MRVRRSSIALLLCLAFPACSGAGGSSQFRSIPQVHVGGGGGCSGGPTSTINANFNGTAVPAGSTLWFTSVFKLQGTNAANLTMNNSVVTVNGVPYYGPDATVNVSPNNTQASVDYTGALSGYTSTSFSGNSFLSAVEVPLFSDLQGGIKNVSWSANFYSDVPNVKVQWQWAAAAYTQLGDYDTNGIKASDDPHATAYGNSDHAGTPENFKTYVIGGGTGGGGSNYTGSYSSTLGVQPAPCTD